MRYDTPETVAKKLETAATISAMWVHYIAENHAGDYFDCKRCNERKGKE